MATNSDYETVTISLIQNFLLPPALVKLFYYHYQYAVPIR